MSDLLPDDFAPIGRAPEFPVSGLPPRNPTAPVHPLVSIEELERPSPQPFRGRPDKDHANLDSLEPLYLPKFLLREWGQKRFLGSAYYRFWRTEAERGQRLAEDFRKKDRG